MLSCWVALSQQKIDQDLWRPNLDEFDKSLQRFRRCKKRTKYLLWRIEKFEKSRDRRTIEQHLRSSLIRISAWLPIWEILNNTSRPHHFEISRWMQWVVPIRVWTEGAQRRNRQRSWILQACPSAFQKDKSPIWSLSDEKERSAAFRQLSQVFAQGKRSITGQAKTRKRAS